VSRQPPKDHRPPDTGQLQGDFPICERPYAEAAAQLGIAEDELLQRLERLLADKVLTRFGPMFQVEAMGGAFVLAALAAPEERAMTR
jgi:DNA-binding Lrp family transcriptional regulator